MQLDADLDRLFLALSHPVRRDMLRRLGGGPLGVLELAEAYEMSQPAVTKHVRVLEEAGLVSRTRDAQRRPCVLAGDGAWAAARWIEDVLRPEPPLLEGLDEFLGRLSRLNDRLA